MNFLSSPEILFFIRDVKLLRQVLQMTATLCRPVDVMDAETALKTLSNRPNVRAMVMLSVPEATAAVELLAQAKHMRPDVLQVLLARPEDLAMAIHGLHAGAIDRLVHVPFAPRELMNILRGAVQTPPARRANGAA